MRRLLAAFLLVVPALAHADGATERFDDPFDVTRTWLAEVSNIQNYYSYPTDRGNNPTGMWISMKNQKPTSIEITFEPEFGDRIARLSIDAACWQPSVFFALDMEGREVFSAPCTSNDNTPVLEYPHHYDVVSQNGIRVWGFRGLSVYGNTAIDNVEVTFVTRSDLSGSE